MFYSSILQLHEIHALLCDHDIWPRWSWWYMSSMWSLSSPPRLQPRVIYCSGTPGESLETTRASPPTSWDQPGHCSPLKGSSIYDQVQVEIKVPVLFRRYIEVHGRPSPVTFLPATPRHPHQMLLRFVKSVFFFFHNFRVLNSTNQTWSICRCQTHILRLEASVIEYIHWL